MRPDPRDPTELLAQAIKVCENRGDYRDPDGTVVPFDAVPPPHDCDGVRYVSRRARLLTAILGTECDGTHLPPEAEARVVLDDLVFVVRPHVPHTEINARTGKPWKSSRHRVFVVCPVCGRRVPVGRIHQHAVVHRAA